MYKYQVDFYHNAVSGCTIKCQSLKECRAEVRGFIEDIMETCTRSRGFAKVGDLHSDHQLTVEHPAFGFEAGAYIKRIKYSRNGSVLVRV